MVRDSISGVEGGDLGRYIANALKPSNSLVVDQIHTVVIIVIII
jgi:hypothetical protein